MADELAGELLSRLRPVRQNHNKALDGGFRADRFGALRLTVAVAHSGAVGAFKPQTTEHAMSALRGESERDFALVKVEMAAQRRCRSGGRVFAETGLSAGPQIREIKK